MRWWTSLKTASFSFFVFRSKYYLKCKKIVCTNPVEKLYCCIFYVGQCVLCTSQSKSSPPPQPPSPGKDRDTSYRLAEQKPIVDCPGTWGLGQELFIQYRSEMENSAGGLESRTVCCK